MLKIAICDDNEIALNHISTLINKNINLDKSLFTYKNAFSLTDYIFNVAYGNIDILIIDINLGDDNGITIATEIKQRYPHIKIIFVTGHINYALDVFDVEPVYFLNKPIDENRLIRAFEKTLQIIEEDKKMCVSLILRGEIINIRVSQIKFIESKKRIIVIYEHNMQREATMKLDEIAGKLPRNFLRCHQSYIINMDRIKCFSLNGAEIYSGEVVPISRPKYIEAKKAFLHYLGEKI